MLATWTISGLVAGALQGVNLANSARIQRIGPEPVDGFGLGNTTSPPSRTMRAACSISLLLSIRFSKLSQIPHQKWAITPIFPFYLRLNRVDKPPSSEFPITSQRRKLIGGAAGGNRQVVAPGLPVAAKGDGMANPRMIWLLARCCFVRHCYRHRARHHSPRHKKKSEQSRQKWK